MPELIIRPYQASDRADVFRIGADTAFFGAPIEAYMEDRNIFLDGFYAYYTDCEPEHTWVAVAEGQVVGFLTGCFDDRMRNRKYARSILPWLLGNLVRGKYRIGRRALKYFGGLIDGLVRGLLPHKPSGVDWSLYPAHLHINVDERWRGYRLGWRLMEAYLGQLRQAGVKGVHLGTTSLNEAACRLYEKVGFKLLEATPDRFWSRWFGHPVEDRSYGMLLES